jgi:phosphoesterase RecJ-like protein
LEDKAKYNFQDGDSEGFVNIPLSIDDVEVSGFFSESKDGYVKVSLRSKNWFSSNRFSNQYFNGGGHEKAAGGRLFIPIEEVPEYFKKSLEQFLLNEKGQQ